MVGLQDLILQQSNDYGRLTVPQLRSVLKDCGLKVSGSKAELVARLQGAPSNVASVSGRKAQAAIDGVAPRRIVSGTGVASASPEEHLQSIAEMMLASGVGVPEPFVSKLKKREAEMEEQPRAGEAAGRRETRESKWIQAVDVAEGDDGPDDAPRRRVRLTRASGREETGSAASSASQAASRGRAGGREQQQRRSIPKGGSAGGSMEQQQQDEGIRISAGRGKARNEQKANHLRGKNNAIQQGRREDNVDELPRLKISGLVLVEGKFDARAVKKAVLVPEVVALQDWVRCPMLTWAPKL